MCVPEETDTGEKRIQECAAKELLIKEHNKTAASKTVRRLLQITNVVYQRPLF